MEWNWLHSLLVGAVGGFFTFLPVPSDVQQDLIMQLNGVKAYPASFRLAVRLGCLIALLLVYYGRVAKLRREYRIASLPARRRKRQPDTVSLMERKLLRIAVVPSIASVVLAPWISSLFGRVWMLAIVLCLNGVLLLLPEYMPGSNKDARSLSPLDSLLIGMSGMLSIIPGISRMATLLSVAKIRGTDQQYALDFTYLLMLPTLAAMCLADMVVLVLGGGNIFAGWMFLYGLLAMLSAAASAYAGIMLMRFLAVKAGFSGFAYYSIGLGMFTFILYLIG